MNVGLNAGAVAVADFHNVSEADSSKLVREFGADDLDEPATRPSLPLVTVNYAPVVPPHHGVYVGRSASIDGKFLYLNEGGGWVQLDLSCLLRDEEFEIIVDPGADLTRLVGYVVEPVARMRGVLRQLLFIHSSSVVTASGKGVLLAAWGNTGKTNLMLQLLQDGCRFYSDDWSLVDERNELHLYPRPVNLMNYNLAMFPELRGLMSRSKAILSQVDAAYRSLSRRLHNPGGHVLRISEFLTRAFEIMANAKIPVSRFVEPSQHISSSLGLVVDVYKVSPGRSLVVQKISVEQFAQRITTCFLYENSRFLQRLAEYASVGDLDYLREPDWTRRYHQLAVSHFQRFCGDEILSLGIPANASRSDFADASKMLLELTEC